MDLVEKLRPWRKKLVGAAETVATAICAPGAKHGLKKSQLNHLVSVCGEASCVEEIANYLQYQGARQSTTGWTPALARSVIEGMTNTLASLCDDQEQVEAWRLYAVFLTRAFTYHDAVRRERERKQHETPRERRR